MFLFYKGGMLHMVLPKIFVVIVIHNKSNSIQKHVSITFSCM